MNLHSSSHLYAFYIQCLWNLINVFFLVHLLVVPLLSWDLFNTFFFSSYCMSRVRERNDFAKQWKIKQIQADTQYHVPLFGRKERIPEQKEICIIKKRALSEWIHIKKSSHMGDTRRSTQIQRYDIMINTAHIQHCSLSTVRIQGGKEFTLINAI